MLVRISRRPALLRLRRAPRRAAAAPTCSRPRSPAASTSSSCARRTRRDDEVLRRGRDRARAVRRGGRAVHPQRPPRPRRARPAPTASTSARTTCRSREARAVVGDGRIVGLSTHSEAQADAARRASTTSPSGPVHATPTKEGRPAIGLDPVAPRRAHRDRAVVRDRRHRRATRRPPCSTRARGGSSSCARSPRPTTPARRGADAAEAARWGGVAVSAGASAARRRATPRDAARGYARGEERNERDPRGARAARSPASARAR